MDVLELLETHRYSEAIAECRRRLDVSPADIGVTAILAGALLALERYEEALPLYEKVDAHEKADNIAQGLPGRQAEISCIHWFLGDWPRAIALMRELAEGILDKSIKFGDAAGGVKQGLLLYYMAVTVKERASEAFALKYLENRAKRSPIRLWPGPVARYYIGQFTFSDVLQEATGVRDLSEALATARDDLLIRRHLCVSLFHEGVKRRTAGDEEGCLEHMRKCYALEDPLIELEWYLARHEVQRALLC
jgi:tetratricopeptide (TPR) repeat protein